MPFDKMAMTIYLMAPVVIGISTFSLQSAIYYSYESIGLFLLGDLTILIVVSLIAMSIVEMPFVEAHKEIDYYVFGTSSKESLVVI